MKRFAILTFASLCLASSAEASSLQIYSDAALTSTTLTDDIPRVVNFYVVLSPEPFVGSSGATFSASGNGGFTGVWLGDTSSYAMIGSSPTKVSIASGPCLYSPVLALTISYQLFGTSSPCSEFRIKPPLQFQIPICWDCFAEYPCIGLGSLLVNCPVATESTTWGKVKALYRN